MSRFAPLVSFRFCPSVSSSSSSVWTNTRRHSLEHGEEGHGYDTEEERGEDLDRRRRESEWERSHMERVFAPIYPDTPLQKVVSEEANRARVMAEMQGRRDIERVEKKMSTKRISGTPRDVLLEEALLQATPHRSTSLVSTRGMNKDENEDEDEENGVWDRYQTRRQENTNTTIRENETVTRKKKKAMTKKKMKKKQSLHRVVAARAPINTNTSTLSMDVRRNLMNDFYAKAGPFSLPLQERARRPHSASRSRSGRRVRATSRDASAMKATPTDVLESWDTLASHRSSSASKRSFGVSPRSSTLSKSSTLASMEMIPSAVVSAATFDIRPKSSSSTVVRVSDGNPNRRSSSVPRGSLGRVTPFHSPRKALEYAAWCSQESVENVARRNRLTSGRKKRSTNGENVYDSYSSSESRSDDGDPPVKPVLPPDRPTFISELRYRMNRMDREHSSSPHQGRSRTPNSFVYPPTRELGIRSPHNPSRSLRAVGTQFAIGEPPLARPMSPSREAFARPLHHRQSRRSDLLLSAAYSSD